MRSTEEEHWCCIHRKINSVSEAGTSHKCRNLSFSFGACSIHFRQFSVFKQQACSMSMRPAGLLRTLINTLELAGRRDEMYLLCHFAKEPCCCRPTIFRARCVNMKQLQSADINKGKRALCQPYRFLGAWDYFFLWLITADHFAQHTKSKNRRCAMSWCWGSVELTMLLSLT